MGKMRSRMEEELRLRGYSRQTVSTYVGAVARFARHYQQPPEAMGAEQVRAYLVHLTEERGLARPTINHALCALRFFYVDVLGRPRELERLRWQKHRKSLPVVLSELEVGRLLGATENVKHQAILMTLYSGGLRTAEMLALEVSDIDSESMRIRVRAGKGGKDRYVMESIKNCGAPGL